MTTAPLGSDLGRPSTSSLKSARVASSIRFTLNPTSRKRAGDGARVVVRVGQLVRRIGRVADHDGEAEVRVDPLGAGGPIAKQQNAEDQALGDQRRH